VKCSAKETMAGGLDSVEKSEYGAKYSRSEGDFRISAVGKKVMDSKRYLKIKSMDVNDWEKPYVLNNYLTSCGVS
jgi:hypothetical protein